MATRASIEALTSLPNQQTRWTHRRIAYNALNNCELTIREISTKVVKPYNAIQKRISELLEDGMIVECGERLENGQTNTIFKQNPNTPTEIEKRLTFMQFAKKHRPQWIAEYESLCLHRL